MNKHKLLISALAAGTIGVTALSLLSGSVFAQGDGRYSPLVQKLVDKFNLSQEEVDTVVSEYQAERRTEMQNRFQERLDQEVEAGNITSEQREKIMAKHEEMQNEMIGQQGLTSDERKAKMDEHRSELEKWAEENGIDVQYLMGFGPGKRGGFGGQDGDGQMKGRGYWQEQ
ncbi:MAG: hypothetical protein WC243_03550 [Patescibacteria group bacterium]|jgi:hypothetical protein